MTYGIFTKMMESGGRQGEEKEEKKVNDNEVSKPGHT